MCCFCRSVLRCVVKPTLHWFMFINSQPAEEKKNGMTLLNNELVSPQNPLTDWLEIVLSL